MDDPSFGGSLPPELDARVRSELRGGERLLWVGQPRPGRFARPSVAIVIFGVVWTYGVVDLSIFMVGFPKGGPFTIVNLFFLLFCIPFVVIGLGMLGSPFWFVRLARRTCYALTDRRAILWEAGWFGGIEVRSYSPADLTKLHRVDYSDGVGDLVFEEVKISSDNDSTQRHGFLAVDRVREIEERMRKALLLGEGQSERPAAVRPPNDDY